MIVILNPVFNRTKSLLPFSADKVTTGRYDFVSFILNVAPVGALVGGLSRLSPCAGTAALLIISVKIQFLDHVKVKDTSQLINDTCNVLQKLLRHFNRTTISTFSITLLLSLLLFGAFPIILLLYLNDSKFVIGSASQLRTLV